MKRIMPKAHGRMRALYKVGVSLLMCMLPVSFGFAQTGKITLQEGAVWPRQTVKIMVGFPAGSSPDLTARLIAEPLAKILGKPVIVMNKPGASGNISALSVAKADDDHTLGLMINGNLTTAQLFNSKVGFDPQKAFMPISLLVTAPLVLVSHEQVGESLQILKSLQAKGSQSNYGSPGVGTMAHWGMEYLKMKVGGLAIKHIPYQGNPSVVQALLSKEIDLALLPPSVAISQIKAGKLRALGISSGGRRVSVSEIPPLTDMGIKDFDIEVWNALVGPANLSYAAQNRLVQAISQILRQEDVRQQLSQQGWQVVGTSPQGLVHRMNDERKTVQEIVKSQNLQIGGSN